jgi:hypothetical protein
MVGIRARRRLAGFDEPMVAESLKIGAAERVKIRGREHLR